jgi:hypothetical protein
MRKVIVCNIMSLDGCYTGPGDNIMVMPMDPTFDRMNAEHMRAATTLVLGRTSYEGSGRTGRRWPTSPGTPKTTRTSRAGTGTSRS